MVTLSKLSFVLILLILVSCGEAAKKGTSPGAKYRITSNIDNYASVTVYDNNDTIYLDAAQNDNTVMIVSDKNTTDSIRNSVIRHLEPKSLRLKHTTITCGAGGSFTVSMEKGNNHLEIVYNNLNSYSEFANISIMLNFLKNRHEEIDKAL